jgi:multidrug efflux pump
MKKEFRPTTWAIKNPTAIYILTILVSIAGIVTYIGLPKERFPDVVLPTIFVQTIYPGVSPTDIENSVTRPLEKQLKSLSGVKKVTSSSIESFSVVTVEFTANIKIEDAKTKVRDAMDKAKNDIPADAQKNQSIGEFDISEFPIMNVNLSGEYDALKLKAFAKMLKDKVEGNQEIKRCDIVGALDREIRVELDLDKMLANNLTFDDIENQFRYNNVNISGGDILVGNIKRTLRVTGEFKSVNDVRNLIIRNPFGGSTHLFEIADVIDGTKDRESFARLDDKPVVTVNIIKRAGENLINAADKIKKTIDEFKKEGKYPEGLKVTLTGDMSKQTQSQLNDLINTVILGFLFVTIVLMFFMGVENAFYVGLSVPLSSLLAFLFMPSLGFSLNVIVLFSFLLALGIVVDDAIVVIENTHRIFNKDKKISLFEAAKEAAGEVFIPVLTGTLTNVAPFFPLLFWPGIVGKFFFYLPVTLIITLFASLVVAFLINPVFAVSFMQRDTDYKKDSIRRYQKPIIILLIGGVLMHLIGFASKSTSMHGFGNFLLVCILILLLVHYILNPLIHWFQDRVLPKIRNGYRRLLTSFIAKSRSRWVFMGAIAFFILSIFIFGASKPKVEFFPSGDPNFVFVYSELPVGTELHYTDSITKIIEARVKSVIQNDTDIVESVIANVAIGAGDPRMPDRTAQSHKSKVTVAFKEFEKRDGKSTSPILKAIRNSIKDIPGTSISVEPEQNGPPTGRDIQIEISGDNFDSLVNISERFKKVIASSGIQGIDQLKSDLILNKPELKIVLDVEKAEREGISVGQAGSAMFAALNGSRNPSKFRDGEDEVPIIARLQERFRSKQEDLLNLGITYRDMATGGQLKTIPISAIAKVEASKTFNGINRKQQRRIVTLYSGIVKGYNANSINADLARLVAEVKLPEGYEIKQGGAQEDQAETSNFLLKAFLGSVALMFVVIVIQFNSSTKPLIVFSTIVFSLSGVFLGYAISHKPFVIAMSGVGILALAGIVVKNGIILIEFIDELKGRGLKIREAIIQGGVTRMTPVILTALAAILGLIPLAVGVNIDFGGLFTSLKPNFYLGGESVVFWGPLAWTIIYGLIVATFLTLIVAPSMYLIRYRMKLKQWRRRHRRKIRKALQSAG